MPKQQSKLFTVVEAPHPNGRCKFYITGYPKGKRERYWFRDRKTAKEEADDRNREILAFGSQADANFTSDARLMAMECMKILAPFGKSLYDAVHFYADHLKTVNSSVTIRVLSEAVRNEFARRVQKGEADPSHRDLMLYALRNLDAAFGDCPAKQITGGELKAWMAATNLAVQTRNNMLGYWHNAFHIAKDLRLVDVNPMTGMDRFKSAKVAKSDNPKCLSVEQLTRLLAVADPEIIPHIALGAFAGIRDEERRKMDWSMIDLNKKRITIPLNVAKIGDERRIPIYDNLLEWITPYAKESGALVTSRQRLDVLLKKAKQAAGLWPWSPRYKNGLRKSFCSYHYEWTGSADRTAEYAGHDIRMLIKTYRHAVEPEDAKRYWEIRPGKPTNVLPMTEAA